MKTSYPKGESLSRQGHQKEQKKKKKEKKIDIFRKGKESWSIEASWMRQRAEESKEGGTPRNCLN